MVARNGLNLEVFKFQLMMVVLGGHDRWKHDKAQG